MRMRGLTLLENNQLILHISNMANGQGIFVHEQIEALNLNLNSNLVHEHFTIRKAKEHKVITYLLAIPRIKKQIRIKNANIVHIHFGLIAIFTLIADIFIKKKINYIVSFYGSDLMSSKIQKLLTIVSTHILRANIIVVSKNLHDELELLKSRKYIIPNSVDPIFFSKDGQDNWIVDLVFTSDPVRPEKDFNFFMSIVRGLQADGFIVNIKIMTHMNRAQIKKCLSQNAIVCLTSKREGSPQIIKEAIVRGIPCICRPVGDVERYVSEYPVLTAVSAEDFKNLIIEVITEKIKFDCHRDLTQFTTATMLKKLNKVYQHVINKE